MSRKKEKQERNQSRNIRRDGNDTFKKLRAEVSGKTTKDLEDELQKLTDKDIPQIHRLLRQNQKSDDSLSGVHSAQVLI